MQVFLNGKFVSKKLAKISVFDLGFLRGYGVFDSLLIKNGEPQFFREHFQRLQKSAKLIGIKLPFAEKKLRDFVCKLAKKNKLQKAKVRITLTPDNFLITSESLKGRLKEAKVCFVQMERSLPGVKSLNYLPSVLANREANKKGFDEALLVNRDGYVTEGSYKNFFWVKKNKIFTPPLEDALGGITHQQVIKLIKKLKISFVEKKVKQKELLAADEIFLTSAPMEIVPVVKIEKRIKKIGEITQQLQEAYRKNYG